jgi:DNA mismatch repair protein MutH
VSARAPAPPPASLEELLARAAALEGQSLRALAAEPLAPAEGPNVHQKGRVGALIERALGAAGVAQAGPDFPALGVELKTLPVDAAGRVRESTFVCRLSLRSAEEVDFEASPLCHKLQHVLFVPIVTGGAERRVGRALSWRPSAAQWSVLRADYDDLVGMIALGKIESLNARRGRWLQLRPKAAHGRVRTRAHNEEGEPLWTMPRGFYLRARFTQALLEAPETLAGAE